ncbi:MAG: M23 family metallopeptidase [Deltaproteobacteria bacterium]|nr:M23 family metallopeptidase [Deltaproteobacteria bacterium]MBW1948765.1 M23 family metallopeptidase [Deltaproteobacteria bacterium]MBW2006443.1 M23 family metallopeptidase [Deltaproteobacteria bacterium]MBW2346334.1 M23 family metallopeptidase [Deltaproteobacteria bacterium]
MNKTKKTGYILGISGLVVLLAFLGWVLTILFEGEQPRIRVELQDDYLSGPRKVVVWAQDTRRGLRSMEVSLEQEGRKVNLFETRFPFRGVFNREGVRRFQKEIEVDPGALNLAQGQVDLTVTVLDYSRRRGGDGNLSVFRRRLIVDTVPPAVMPLSRMHYINRGGTGLVVYRASSDTVESGVFVNRRFFKGFPYGGEKSRGYVCYFAVDDSLESYPSIHLWAKDRAGNTARASFNHRVRWKRFRKDRIHLTERFLKRVMMKFEANSQEQGRDLISRFLKINRELRKENARFLEDLMKKTSPRKLWDGTWLRMKNAATMARFADRRDYYYNGKRVDQQVHRGVDLASLAQSKVEAANSGKVLYAGELGIYGLVVVLDHGQGLASLYGHLSSISVRPGQEVAKGQELGRTGSTGLAGGDHLHFSVLVGGVFVNPVEWWDPHWIRDNVTKKLALLQG